MHPKRSFRRAMLTIVLAGLLAVLGGLQTTSAAPGSGHATPMAGCAGVRCWAP